MWVLVVVGGLVVELAVIVLLGRSAIRRDEEVPGYGPAVSAGLAGSVEDVAVRSPPGTTATAPSQ